MLLVPKSSASIKIIEKFFLFFLPLAALVPFLRKPLRIKGFCGSRDSETRAQLPETSLIATP